MSNIRVGGRTYRDVEKMSFEDLLKLADTIIVALKNLYEHYSKNDVEIHKLSPATLNRTHGDYVKRRDQIEALQKRLKYVQKLMNDHQKRLKAML